jgi:hypothetical protein
MRIPSTLVLMASLCGGLWAADQPPIVIGTAIVAITATTPETTEGQLDAPAILTVTRTGDLSAPLTVAYTVTGTANPWRWDYTALPGSVKVPALARSATIAIVALSDSEVEADETVIVTLGSGAGYAIGIPNAATATIRSSVRPPVDPPVRPIAAFAAAKSDAREDAGSAKIEVKLSRSTTVETRIGYAATGGTATAGADFTAVSGDLIFPASSTVQTITIPVVNDAINDPSETIVLSLARPVGLDLGSPLTHTVTLKESSILLRVDALADTIFENDATGTAFRFSRTGEAEADLTFSLQWSSGTAVVGTHVVGPLPTSITIPKGRSFVDVPVVPVNNQTIGNDVSLCPWISSVPSGVTLEQAYRYLYILDDEAPVLAARVTPSPIREGSFAYVYIGLTNEQGQNVSRHAKWTVGYQLSGTGVEQSDFYMPLAGSVTTSPDSAIWQEVCLRPSDDGIDEGPETVLITLTSGALTARTSTTILDLATVTISVTASSISESATQPASFRFVRTGQVRSALSIPISWTSMATAGKDFVGALPSTVDFAPGQEVVEVPIQPINDQVIESDESIQIEFSNLSFDDPGSTMGYRIQYDDYDPPCIIILDDERPVLSVVLQPADIYEGRYGQAIIGLHDADGIPISRSVSQTISWTISGPSADDWLTPESGILTIYPFIATDQYITLAPAADGVEDGPEAFTVSATLDAQHRRLALGGAGARDGSDKPLVGQASGRILERALVTFSVTASSISESATQPASFRFERTGMVRSALSIPISWISTATAERDFVGTLPSTIDFAPGQNVVEVPILPIDDRIIESDEFIQIQVHQFNEPGYTIKPFVFNTPPRITILDDEQPVLSVVVQPADIYEGQFGQAIIGLQDADGKPISRSVAQTISWTISGPRANDWSNPISGTLFTYPDLAYDQSVNLAPVADYVAEGPESFTVSATLVPRDVAAKRLTRQASGRILDRAMVSIAVSPTSVDEAKNDKIHFTITRTGVINQETKVNLFWSAQAKWGSDFKEPLPSSVTIAAGMTSASVVLNIINDAEVEGDESITLRVQSETAYLVTGPSTVTCTIYDDEIPIVLATFDYGINAEGNTSQLQVSLGGTDGSPIMRQRVTRVAYAITGVAAGDVTVPLLGTITFPVGVYSGTLNVGLKNDGIAEGVETARVVCSIGARTATAILDIIEITAGGIVFQPATVAAKEPGFWEPDLTVQAALSTGWTIPSGWEAKVSMAANDTGTATWRSDLWGPLSEWSNVISKGMVLVPVATVRSDDVYEGGPHGVPEQTFVDLNSVTFRQGSRLSPTFTVSRSKALTIAIQDEADAMITIQRPTPQQILGGRAVTVAFTVNSHKPLREVRVNGIQIASGSVTPGPMTATVTLPHLGVNTIRIWVVSFNSAVVQATVVVNVLPAAIPLAFVDPALDANGIGTLTGAPVARAFAETAGEANLTLSATVEPEGQPTASTPATATWDGQYILVDFGRQVAGRYVLRLTVATPDGSRSGSAMVTVIYDPSSYTPDPTTNRIVIQRPQNGSTLTFFGAR